MAWQKTCQLVDFRNVEYYCGQHFMHDGPDSKHKDIPMCSVKASCHRKRYHRVTSQSRRWIRRECNHKEARVLGSILVRVNLLVSESRLMTRQSSVTIESWFYTITERITQGSADSPSRTLLPRLCSKSCRSCAPPRPPKHDST